ncbi:MAG: hypothetical protein ACT4PV_01500 [Planctomycetaceae bacterium]
MSRWCALLVCVLAGCVKKGPLLEIRLTDLQPGETTLDFSGTMQYSARSLPFEAQSRAERPLRLGVRLEPPLVEGMSVRLAPELQLLPKGSGRSVLVIGCPNTLGPFRGQVTIFAEGETALAATYTFVGEIVPFQLAGPNIDLDPPGLALDRVRPGEDRAFVFAVRNIGTESLIISEWRPDDPARLLLRGVQEGDRIVPGGELQVNGTVRAPSHGGTFERSIRIFSNAKNANVREFRLAGTVVAPYELLPGRFEGRLVRSLRPEVPLVVRASEGEAPFTVESVAGIEPWFEVVATGTRENAAEQRILLRLRADARVGPAQFDAAVRLAPAGIVLRWSAAVDVLPNVVADPARLVFAKVPRDTSRSQIVQLHHSAGKPFRVREVRAPAHLQVVLEHPAGLEPRLVVSLVPRTPPGLYDQPAIELLTDDADTPRLLVPVRLEIVD